MFHHIDLDCDEYVTDSVHDKTDVVERIAWCDCKIQMLRPSWRPSAAWTRKRAIWCDFESESPCEWKLLPKTYFCDHGYWISSISANCAYSLMLVWVYQSKIKLQVMAAHQSEWCNSLFTSNKAGKMVWTVKRERPIKPVMAWGLQAKILVDQVI